VIASLFIGDHDLTPVLDQAMERHRSRTNSLADQLQDIRRRLWILSGSLASLPGRIDLACRKNGVLTAGHEPNGPQHNGDEPGDIRPASEAEGVLGGWRARWKRARLRSRASGAERHAAVAIHDASASFAAALEAVLHAAIARAKADGACDLPCCAPAPRRRDQGDDRMAIALLERNSS